MYLSCYELSYILCLLLRQGVGSLFKAQVGQNNSPVGTGLPHGHVVEDSPVVVASLLPTLDSTEYLGISAGREAWAWFKGNGGAHCLLFMGTSLLGGGRGGASARTW